MPRVSGSFWMCLGASLAIGNASLAQPAVNAIAPYAVTPGKTTEVTLTGAKLPADAKVWTSIPGQVQVVVPPEVKDATKIICKFTLDARTPLGVGGIIVATPEGQTDVVPILIDDVAAVAEVGTNHALATPQDLSLPGAIDGTSDGNVFDYFRFTAKSNQRVNIEVWASRWGQDFDPVLRLLDATGRELALADDDAALGADCRLSFVAPADGQYVLELRDNRYKGGGRYRLRAGDFPLVTTAFPLAIPNGIATSVAAVGPAVEGVAPQTLFIPFGSRPEVTALTSKVPGGQAASGTRLSVESVPVTLEVTDDSQTPPIAQVPGVLTGRLDAPGDLDKFQFQATKGERLTFQAYSRSLGSPAVVAMRVLNGAGAQIAETAPTETDEESLAVTVPDDGVYQLVALDLLGRGGADYTYKIDVSKGPTFQLVQKKDPKAVGKFVAAPGGAFYLDVQVVRGGYDGPVTLALAGGRNGWQLVNNVIAAKAPETRVYILPPSNWSAADLEAIVVVGQGDASVGNRVVTMSRVANFRTTRPTWPLPPDWVQGLISVSGSAAKPFYVAAPNRGEISFPRLVGQTSFIINFERIDAAFKDVPLTLLFPQLPPGITAEVKRSAPGAKETYEVTLKGAKDLPEGRHTLRYFAFAEFQNRGQGEISGNIPVHVVTPLAATVAPAGPLVQGKTVKVKLTVARLGDDKQPVELKFKALPAGVTGPEKVALPPEQSEIEVDLTAAADAAIAKFEQLAVAATTKYAGQDIAVDSPNVALEVKAP